MTHSYIDAFVAALGAAGHGVINVEPTAPRKNELARAHITVQRNRGRSVEFHAWVEQRINLHTGRKLEFGYVNVAHDPFLGRARLIDWTNLSTGGNFNMKANGAGEAVRRALR